MYVRGYLQGSENGRVVTIASNRRRRSINVANFETSSVFYTNIKSYHEKCFIFNINIETSRITFKRKHDDLNQYDPLDSHLNHRRMGHGFRFLPPPFSLLPPLFSKFSYKSFLFKIFIIIRFFFILQYQ